jgi:hypothetical protein
MSRSVSILHLGQDGDSEVAFLLPKAPYIDRMELTAETRADYNIPSGTRSVVLQYDAADPVFVRVYTDSNLTMPSGDVADGEAPFINPTGLSALESGDMIQFISAGPGAVHIVCVG